MTAKKTQKHVAKTAPKAPKTVAAKPKVDDVAKTVAAVTSGDLTVGVTVPTAGKKVAKAVKQPKAKAHKAGCTMSGIDAAAKVLAESASPLNAKAIVAKAAAAGYWASTAKTPDATLYASMLTEMKKLGTASRFAKAGRGLWSRAGLAKVTKVVLPGGTTAKPTATTPAIKHTAEVSKKA